MKRADPVLPPAPQDPDELMAEIEKNDAVFDGSLFWRRVGMYLTVAGGLAVIAAAVLPRSPAEVTAYTVAVVTTWLGVPAYGRSRALRAVARRRERHLREAFHEYMPPWMRVMFNKVSDDEDAAAARASRCETAVVSRLIPGMMLALAAGKYVPSLGVQVALAAGSIVATVAVLFYSVRMTRCNRHVLAAVQFRTAMYKQASKVAESAWRRRG